MQNNSFSIATYNVLHPFFAVQWAETAGLTKEARALSLKFLQESTESTDESAWVIFSNWDKRASKVSENIKLADIICLQEVASDTLSTLQKLTGYEIASEAYHFYPNDKEIETFGNAILYKREKIALKNSFELVHKTESYTRRGAAASFTIEGKTFEIASLHLSGYYSKESDLEKKQAAKLKGFNELQTFSRKLEKEKRSEGVDGIVIAGDFNEDPSEASFELYRPGFLLDQSYQWDGNLKVTEPLKERRIDWLFYKPLTTGVQLTPMDLESRQKPASDHLMTGTVLEWK